MEKRLLAIVPLVVLLGSIQAIRVAQAQDTWELTLVLVDVPSDYQSVEFQVYKGYHTGDEDPTLFDSNAGVDNGYAASTFQVYWADVGDGDHYTVCYYGIVPAGNTVPSDDQTHCSTKTHNAGNDQITLTTHWGELP